MPQVLGALFVGYMVVIFIVKVVWPFLVEVVFPIVGAGIVLVLSGLFLVTLGWALRDMYVSFTTVRAARLGAPAVLYKGEAKVAYIFGPVVDDVKAFFLGSWSLAQKRVAQADDSAKKASGFWETLGYRILYVFALTFGLGAVVVTSLVAALIFGIVAAVAATVFVLIYAVDLTYLSLHGLFAHCPECHDKSFHLHYDCPECKGTPQRHRHLRVNRAGALYHRCVCGSRVPAHVLTGRGVGMNAYCALNEHPINTDLVGTKTTHVALVGGPDSGKTTFAVALLRHLLKDPRHAALSSRLEDPVQERQMKRWIADLEAGRNPPKTAVQRNRAMTVLYTDSVRRRRSLYIFDPSGEMFSNRRQMVTHSYFDTSDVILFLLDPLSLTSFRNEMTLREGVEAVGAASPSATRPATVAASLIELMESAEVRQRDGKFQARLLLVVTKCDVMDLSREFSNGAAGIRNWLNAHGAGDILRLLDAKFEGIELMYVSQDSALTGAPPGSVTKIVQTIVDHAQATAPPRGRFWCANVGFFKE